MPLSASEASIEAELKLKGLNAPRLTPALIDAAIVGEDYHVFPGTTMTICALEGYLLREKLSRGDKIAETCHQANKALCAAFGDTSQPDWAHAPGWQRASAINGVRFCIANPDAPPSANHDAWMAEKVAAGWVFGRIKDEQAKTHPCIVPYDALPEFQRAKDHVFKAIVGALA